MPRNAMLLSKAINTGKNNLTTDKKDAHRYKNPCLSVVKNFNLITLTAMTDFVFILPGSGNNRKYLHVNPVEWFPKELLQQGQYCPGLHYCRLI